MLPLAIEAGLPTGQTVEKLGHGQRFSLCLVLPPPVAGIPVAGKGIAAERMTVVKRHWHTSMRSCRSSPRLCVSSCAAGSKSSNSFIPLPPIPFRSSSPHIVPGLLHQSIYSFFTQLILSIILASNEIQIQHLNNKTVSTAMAWD
ncbi:hypothetical protein PIB30_082010 [Stylosanthes scabra]|uniref:Uncharacterized protein n=1 Tax=Stylosanthes scabra TaxID=79078 RepID=A0ABU6TT66_9FABA|nr:hypothetical protein [Stylosanthes scabra]